VNSVGIILHQETTATIVHLQVRALQHPLEVK